VQSMKAGIMEIADIFVINKADRPGADTLEREVQAMLGLSAQTGDWLPPILKVVATEGAGIGAVLEAVREFQESGAKRNRRAEMWRLRLREMLRERLLERVPAGEIEAAAEEVAARRRDPYSVIDEWLKRI
jgi:LAO/AO transport system kinase